jgi:hypothetical protein
MISSHHALRHRRPRRTRAGLACALLVALAAGCTRASTQGKTRSGERADPSLPASGRHAVSEPRMERSPRESVHRGAGGGARGLPAELSFPRAAQLIAIGDLHGDLDATRRALQLAEAIDDEDHWSGGDLWLVQTGDVLDRGDDDRAIVDLLQRLRDEAAEAGGRVVLLSGNHELMNVELNFSYVTPLGFETFGGMEGRRQAFRPGGVYARKLASQPIVARVGDTVFVHGGVLSAHVRYGLGRMADEVRHYMLGELSPLPAGINDGSGLLWTRLYSQDTPPSGCTELLRTLDLLKAKRMVVAHTPQLAGITSACDDRVYRIDVGMSRFYGGPVEVLEIRNDETVTTRREAR